MLERLVMALRDAGVSDVHVVIGPYAETLLPLVARSGARAVMHQHPNPSLIDSQRLALNAHEQSLSNHDLMLVLADLPLLNATDVVHLMSHWQQRASTVQALMPMVDGVRGHPLLLSQQAVALVTATPNHLGVRAWLDSHPSAVWQLNCAQKSFVTDVDNHEDILKLQTHLHPTLVTW